MSIEKELSQFDKAFDEAEVQRGKADLPAGDYKAIISAAEIFKSKDDRLFMKIALIVLEGDQEGVTFDKLYSLDNPERLGFLKSDLLTCGVQLGKFSELPSKLKDLDGIGLKVHAKVNGKYTNYYFNGKLSPEAEDVGENGVPF